MGTEVNLEYYYELAKIKTKYYVIGMWLVTESYNKNGYIIDVIICKGKNLQEALKEASDYENEIKNIEFEKYLPLSVGETVFEATKDIKDIYNMIHKDEMLPNNSYVEELVEKAKKKEAEIDARD